MTIVELLRKNIEEASEINNKAYELEPGKLERDFSAAQRRIAEIDIMQEIALKKIEEHKSGGGGNSAPTLEMKPKFELNVNYNASLKSRTLSR